jgi:hypothetical protein
MSLLNSASLVVTPNAYKEGTLYSVIPNTTLGDMTVVRATTATRVNSAGIIELVPYNLVTYSEQFDNASWTKINATITSNSTTSPDGTINADKLVEDTSTGGHSTQSVTLVSNSTIYTTSVFVKYAGREWIRFTDAQSSNRIHFNTLTGAFGTISGTVIDYNKTALENGWYKLSFTTTSVATAYTPRIALAEADNDVSYTGDGVSGVYIWGAQLNEGTIKDYLRTETRLNIPRLDYSNGSCPSLLLEPQRTNLVTYSEQFDNASWTKVSCSITSNSTISPDGTTTADRLVLTSVSPASQTMSRQAAIVTSTTTVTFSTFVKYVDKQYIQLVFAGSFSSQFANFDLINGTVTAGTYVGANVQNYGNGWYRISITTTGLNTNCLPFIWALDTALAGRAADSTSTGTSAYLLWGAQVEAGSYATSYIPTTSAAVTRNADAISKTGISSLIGQSEGVLYAEINALKYPIDINNWLTITDGTNANSVGIVFETTGAATARIEVGGVIQAYISTSVDYSNFIKVAFKYKENDFAWWVNGVEVGTDLSGITFPSNTLNSLQFAYGSGSNKWAGNVKLLAVFNEALSDSELETLTT